MIVTYNRKRTFRVWELNGTWYGTETKNISCGKLKIPYSECMAGKVRNDVVDQIETRCRYEELLGNGMSQFDAMQEALF